MKYIKAFNANVNVIVNGALISTVSEHGSACNEVVVNVPYKQYLKGSLTSK
jgi:hypothetical protein